MSILLRQSFRTIVVGINLSFLFIFVMVSLPCSVRAQENGSSVDLKEEVRELRAMVQQLQKQVSDLQARVPESQLSESSDNRPSAQVPAQTQPAQQTTQGGSEGAQKLTTPESHNGFNLLGGTTVSFMMDGYYLYNFNNPIGRVNLLRAYDVSSNAFSLQQADVVIENAPDPSNGKRYGARLDLQFGQATDTLQGNTANEPRPNIYRNIFQAYGNYVVPLGSGLTVDFGKWASSLGIEGNYTKDQWNYSRSYWFNFLPFYHMGFRTRYQINGKLAVNYWVTNGTDQTEPFNGFKDELVGLNIQPSKNIAWTVNYYFGQEHPDFQYFPVGTSGLPTQQGIPFAPIPNPANGKLHIFDSYITWNLSPKWTLAIEGDYVIQRLQTYSPPSHTSGGAVYARYQFMPKLALATRAEYLSDRGGMFSGLDQALKETTVTLDWKVADGFVIRPEWRIDWSNRPFFLTDTLGVLSKQQNTLGFGLVWWFGGKEGAW
jgi:hypothetical protein